MTKFIQIYSLFILLVLVSSDIYAQKITISGYVEDNASGEKLIGANVRQIGSEKGTITNTYGFYSITLDTAELITLSYSYIGYQEQTISINGSKSVTNNVKMKGTILLNEIEITATKDNKIEESTQMSKIEVSILQIKKIPALLGEVDVLKALQLLPGVQSGGEGQSGLYVRGGSPDQNLILLDGVPVYNANHLFGFFSVFNADAIKDVSLIKGGFPARYGGRLSSVIEINLKEGNNQEFHGDLSIGLISSKLTLEGPINKGKTSFLVSGRRTYIDVLAQPLIQQQFKANDSEGSLGYYFYDLNAKVNHTFSQRDRLYVSVYTGDDVFYFNEESKNTPKDFVGNRLSWGNLTSAIRWNHIIHDKLFMNTSLTYSKYQLLTSAESGTKYRNGSEDKIGLSYTSGIEDYAAKIDFDYIPSPKHFVRFGANVINHKYVPGTFDLEQIDSQLGVNFKQSIAQKKIFATELATYIEDDFEVSDKLKVNGGLHFSAFAVNEKFYTSLQPRLSARYLLPNGIGLKASFATMRQFINLLAFEGIGLPTDLWLPSTDRILPQNSWQAAIGAAKSLGDSYEISLEGYYKKMKNLTAYKDGSGLFELTDWQDRVTQGDGESYGVELFLQRKKGKFTGWIGYTLSWNFRTFPDIDDGKPFPYRYDRRHDLSIVGTYDVSKKINIAATWVYGTGNAVTLPNSAFQLTDNTPFGPSTSYVEGFGQRNNFRMRSYHRADIGINFIKKSEKRTRTWSVGAYNAYSRQNPFYLFFSQEDDVNTGDSETVLKQASLFPIIPYVTYSLKF